MWWNKEYKMGDTLEFVVMSVETNKSSTDVEKDMNKIKNPFPTYHDLPHYLKNVGYYVMDQTIMMKCLNHLKDKNAFDILEGDGANVSEFIYDGKIINWVTRGRIDWHCYMDYIRHPINLSHRDYGVILVDGRARAMCAYVAKDLLKDDGYLLFHDFNNRPYYHGILNWYEIIDTQGSLAVLTKKIRGNS